MTISSLTPLHDADFYRVMHASHGPAIVFFTSAGCNSCRYWRQLLEQLVQARTDLVVYVVDAGASMGLAQEYEVFHLPALFLFRDGHYHAPLQCEASLAALTGTLDAALAQPAQEAP